MIIKHTNDTTFLRLGLDMYGNYSLANTGFLSWISTVLESNYIHCYPWQKPAPRLQVSCITPQMRLSGALSKPHHLSVQLSHVSNSKICRSPLERYALMNPDLDRVVERPESWCAKCGATVNLSDSPIYTHTHTHIHTVAVAAWLTHIVVVRYSQLHQTDRRADNSWHTKR